MVPHIKDSNDLRGKRIFLRLDCNVPVQDGVIQDEFRIERAFPTLEFLRDQGAQTLIFSHIEGGSTSLKPVYEFLKSHFAVTFSDDYIENSPQVEDGEFVLCENIRNHAGEEANDEHFSKKLAELADIYVNDAFAVSHREHASIVGVPKHLPHYAGFLIHDEIKHLTEALKPERPFLFILGGAKFETKLPLIEKFLDIADQVFVGGALSQNILREKGLEVGESLVSDGHFDLKHIVDNPKLILPRDFIVTYRGERRIRKAEEIEKEEAIVDAGPETVEHLRGVIKNSKQVLWNGPLGGYERGDKIGTLKLAKMISESHDKSIIGGGDTLAAIKELVIGDKFYFVSTGGGAMLDFLVHETLPGLEALKS